MQFSSEPSIQWLFAQLKLTHLQQYLPSKGWNKAGQEAGGSVRFELHIEEDPYIILLPLSDDSQQSARLLERAIYCLSGVEDRQPREIIGEMLEAHAPEPEATLAAGDNGQPSVLGLLRLRNAHSAAVTLKVASRSAEVSLLPGEAIELSLGSPGHGPPEIEIAGTVLRINDGPGGSLP